MTRPGRASTLSQAFLLVRGSTLGFSLSLPIVGAATSGSATVATAARLLPVALCFHVFIYVLNDVVDLPVDRTEARRAAFPLVSGEITVRTALGIVGAAFLTGLAAAMLVGASAGAVVLLLAAFAAGGAYDLWGKRARVPPVTDAIQGLAWAALLAYGAAAYASPTVATALIASYVIVLIVLVNGLHGGLRDLANDARCGARTTAIWMGATPSRDGVRVPARLLAYALGLQVLLVVLAPAAVAYGSGRTATVGLTVVTGVAGTLALLLAARRADDPLAFRHLGALHLLTALLILVVLALDSLTGGARLVLVAVFLAPLAFDRATRSAVLWLARPWRRVHRDAVAKG